MSPLNKKSVLFVCLGNICRSTMAEGVFRSMIKNRSDFNEWKVDSCATSNYNTGCDPDDRTMRTLRKNGVVDYSHEARQNFYFIFGMDSNNLKNLKSMTPSDYAGVIRLLGDYDETNSSSIIRDPYYDNDEKGFHKVYDQCQRACAGFLEKEAFD